MSFSRTLLLAGLLAAAPAVADPAQAVAAWRAFAAASGDPRHRAFAEAIAEPGALQLARDWAALRGYDVYSLLAAAHLPADLKPGLVITRDNAARHPWLGDYLPRATLERLMSTGWFPIREIVIVPSVSYGMSRGTLAATREVVTRGITAHVDAEGDLRTPDGHHWLLDDATAGAIPFLHPASGIEVHWTQAAHGVGTPDMHFRPMRLRACDRDNRIDREFTADLWWQKMHGRRDLPPRGSVPGMEDVVEAGSIFFIEPFEVNGLAAVRLRTAALGEDDRMQVFIPSIGRTRVMSGSDVQDTMGSGLEVTWDDWRGVWQKASLDRFAFHLLGTRWVLVQPESGLYFGPELDATGCGIARMYLELRPVWVYEMVNTDGRYQYRRRVIYVDRELYHLQYEEMDDPRGNLYRLWDDVRAWRPADGLAQWSSVLVWNPIARRMNWISMQPVWGRELESAVDEAAFDLDQLRDYQ